MSLRLTLVTALLLVCSVCDVTEAIDNFDDVEGDFHFIYHDEHDLLLMVSDRSCIYIRVQDSLADETKYLITYQQTTEEYLLDIVRRHHSRLHASDQQSVRDQFADRLADFHCLDHIIYTLTLDFNDIQVVQSSHCQWCSVNHCPRLHNCHSLCTRECPTASNVAGPGTHIG